MVNKEFPEEGDAILGTVDKIVGTSVFVKLDDYNQEGVMNFSEVSPGRIRNIRDYIMPNQKIVCKVLRVDKVSGHIDLSLRRVNTREKREILELHKKQKDVLAMIKFIIEDKKRFEQLTHRIRNRFGLAEFFTELIEKSTKPEKSILMLKEIGFNENEAKQFLKLVAQKVKERRVSIKAKISLSSEADDGVEKIKKIFNEAGKKAKIFYIGAPNYLIAVSNINYKEANKKLNEILNEINTNAKKLGCNFDYQKMIIKRKN